MKEKIPPPFQLLIYVTMYIRTFISLHIWEEDFNKLE